MCWVVKCVWLVCRGGGKGGKVGVREAVALINALAAVSCRAVDMWAYLRKGDEVAWKDLVKKGRC